MRSFPLPYQPVPVPAPAAHPCDISRGLRERRYQELDQALREACEESFTTREKEAFYMDRLNDFDHSLDQDDATDLAQIRAWQAALPTSGHAYLIEAHYWYHWAYVYRGSGWASSVTDDGWTCAHAAVANLCAAVLRALALDARLWAAPVIMMKGVAAFREPGWLTDLMLTGRSKVTSVAHAFASAGAALREPLADLLAQSGMAPDDRVQVPAERPAALPAPMQGKKRSKLHHYWMEAAFHIHPRLFVFLRQYVWFLQPRWGGSHERVRAFVASEHCAHLDAVEKDRLLHEIWRDDYLGDHVDKESEPGHAAQAMDAARRRAAEALHPYHRYEVLVWLARSHNFLDRETEALEFLKRAEAEHPIDSEIVMQIAHCLSIKYEPESTWIAQAVCRSAEGGHTASARLLYGYFALRGLHGFVCDQDTGKAWLDAAHRASPKGDHFREVGGNFYHVRMLREAVEIWHMGYDHGSPRCCQVLGDVYERGIHVEADSDKAMHFHQEAMEQGDAYSALEVAWLHRVRAQSASTDEELAHHEGAAIVAAIRAHELENEKALDTSFKYVAWARLVRIRHEHMAWVKKHADEGHAIAMAAWASMLGTYEDTELYNQRESVRWLMGAQAIAPDDDYVKETEAFLQGTGWMSKLLYRLTRKRIGAHEIPGTDNAMV